MGVVRHRPQWLSRGKCSSGGRRQEEVKANKGFHRKRSFKGLAGKWATITSTTKPVPASSGRAISFLVTVTPSVDLGPLGVYLRVG